VLYTTDGKQSRAHTCSMHHPMDTVTIEAWPILTSPEKRVLHYEPKGALMERCLWQVGDGRHVNECLVVRHGAGSIVLCLSSLVAPPGLSICSSNRPLSSTLNDRLRLLFICNLLPPLYVGTLSRMWSVALPLFGRRSGALSATRDVQAPSSSRPESQSILLARAL
jgi:hypothetical protein